MSLYITPLPLPACAATPIYSAPRRLRCCREVEARQRGATPRYDTPPLPPMPPLIYADAATRAAFDAAIAALRRFRHA